MAVECITIARVVRSRKPTDCLDYSMVPIASRCLHGVRWKFWGVIFACLPSQRPTRMRWCIDLNDDSYTTMLSVFNNMLNVSQSVNLVRWICSKAKRPIRETNFKIHRAYFHRPHLHCHLWHSHYFQRKTLRICRMPMENIKFRCTHSVQRTFNISDG